MVTQTRPVLVVDDDEAVRHSLKFALELEGLNIRLYQSAADLLDEPLVVVTATGTTVIPKEHSRTTPIAAASV